MFGHQDNHKDDNQTTSVSEPTNSFVASDGDQDSPVSAPPVPDEPNPALPPDDFPLSPLGSSDTASDAATDGPTSSPMAPTDNSDIDGLLDIKQQALQQLTPLVDHLDQSPEEKFRTTMMMIQAADNQDLIKTAYEAAQKITDEKARAQALLDIVNEINYFTQPKN